MKQTKGRKERNDEKERKTDKETFSEEPKFQPLKRLTSSSVNTTLKSGPVKISIFCYPILLYDLGVSILDAVLPPPLSSLFLSRVFQLVLPSLVVVVNVGLVSASEAGIAFGRFRHRFSIIQLCLKGAQTLRRTATPARRSQ